MTSIQLQGMSVKYEGAVMAGRQQSDSAALTAVSAVLSAIILVQAGGLWLMCRRSVAQMPMHCAQHVQSTAHASTDCTVSAQLPCVRLTKGPPVACPSVYKVRRESTCPMCTALLAPL